MFQKNSKTLWLWLLVGLVVIVLAALAALKDQKPSQEGIVPKDISQWQEVTNSEYSFRVKYPERLQAVESEGSSDLMGRFLSVDFGTEAELDLLQQANDSPGSGDPALFLRLTVAASPDDQAPNCGEYTYVRDLALDGALGVLCEGETMTSQNAMMAIVKHEGRNFVFESGKYAGANRSVIDAILQSLEFVE